jgi:tRNA threonylcarbamoyl adenosine modification protein (Sua5/YciO/YrdC/YwlC family)
MIEYVLPHNPDDRVLEKAKCLLAKGGVVCLPTDTNWVLLADAYCPNGVEKIYQWKRANKHKHYSLICSSLSMASEVAVVPDYAFKLLKRCVPGHYTFIFEATKKITKHLKASKTDKEIGLRFPPGDFLAKFLENFDNPLLSTQVSSEMLGIEGEMEIYGHLIEESIGPQIDLIIDPGEVDFSGPSTIYSFARGEVELVREGAGKLF